MLRVITDRRYLYYYVFTALIIAILLTVEDALEERELIYSQLVIDFLISVPLLIAVSFVVSMGSYPIVTYLNKYFPWEDASTKRMFIEVSAMVVLVAIFSILTTYARNAFLGADHCDCQDPGLEGLIISIIMFFISFFMIMSFHEFIILSSDKALLFYRTKVLERQNYLIKYEALKSQINPHFLFNSLNVLSSLIYIDTQKSDQFIHKFSDVFRYVLELNQERVVKLSRELAFLDSYLFLQKIRYGDSLQICKTVADVALDKFVPPLTLQLVAENAIKHNVISKEQVLKIEIYIENDELVIKNNLQGRTVMEGSTGIGQKNLISKYELIADRLPTFCIQGDSYIARLPLLDEGEWKE